MKITLITKKEIGTLTIWMEKNNVSTLILIFLLIGILIVIGLMIYQIISQREESILKSNENSNQIEKMSNWLMKSIA